MRSVGDKRARTVEQGAGEIEPLLDIDRARRRLERDAHILGNRHEEIIEDLKPHWIGVGSRRALTPEGR